MKVFVLFFIYYMIFLLCLLLVYLCPKLFFFLGTTWARWQLCTEGGERQDTVWKHCDTRGVEEFGVPNLWWSSNWRRLLLWWTKTSIRECSIERRGKLSLTNRSTIHMHDNVIWFANFNVRVLISLPSEWILCYMWWSSTCFSDSFNICFLASFYYKLVYMMPCDPCVFYVLERTGDNKRVLHIRVYIHLLSGNFCNSWIEFRALQPST